MKTGFSPAAMLDAERAAGSGVEDTSGNEQQPAAGAFDAVLAMVAAQVATLGAANKPTAPGVALPQPPQVAGEPAKDLTKAKANTTGDSALWLDGARAMQLAELAHGPTDVLPGVPFHQLVATQAGQPLVSAAPTVEPAAAVVQPALPTIGEQAPALVQPAQGMETKVVAVGALQKGPIVPEEAVVSAPITAPLAVDQPALAPAPQTAVVQSKAEIAAATTKRAGAQSGARRADDKGALQASVHEQSAQTDARLLAQSGAGLASPVQVAASAGAARNNVTNAETTTSSAQNGTASGRSPGVSRMELPLAAPSEADLSLPAFSLSMAAAQPSAPRPSSDKSPVTAASELGAPQLSTASTPVLPQPVLPQPVLPQPVLPQSVLPQSVLPQSVLPQSVLPRSVLPRPAQPVVVAPLAAAAPAPSGAAPNLAAQSQAAVAPTEVGSPQVRAEASLPVAANVQVELVELPSEQMSGNDGAPGELSPRELANELDAGGERREPGSDAQSQGEAQQGASEQRNPQPQPFQSSEVQGARGLEQVVASLLRASANNEVPGSRATGSSTSGLAVSNTAQPVLTQKSGSEKSGSEKSAQLSGDASQALLEAAQRREQALAERELSVEGPAHLPSQHEAKAAAEPSAAEPAPVALPLPTPSIADPDAAMMGKLARGEGVNAANISIDHPELGAMDLLVQSENGRVEVRATAETPKAAAVLRAHESALRYGIQQAGLTFGALKVRSRGGEGPAASKRAVARASDDGTRGTVKQRRRNHEWEA